MNISIGNIRLSGGSHSTREQGTCFMEAVAWIANETHSDHPECVCPVFGAFIRRFQDDIPDKERQKLKPYLVMAIGTAEDGFGERRAWMCLDWYVRTVLPIYLECFGHVKEATNLRLVGEICSAETWSAAKPSISRTLAGLAAALDLAALADRATRAAQQITESGFALVDRMLLIQLEKPSERERELAQPVEKAEESVDHKVGV